MQIEQERERDAVQERSRCLASNAQLLKQRLACLQRESKSVRYQLSRDRTGERRTATLRVLASCANSIQEPRRAVCSTQEHCSHAFHHISHARLGLAKDREHSGELLQEKRTRDLGLLPLASGQERGTAAERSSKERSEFRRRLFSLLYLSRRGTSGLSKIQATAAFHARKVSGVQIG